ncbi:hypothetical protein RsTz2092_00420 [Deferribacterales bacterium RsTz2092]|nr:hypothetical protein AGMMS49941_01290 [Deferribacterales bacterium]
MKCPKCNEEEMNSFVVQKQTGCLGVLGHLLLGSFTLGAWWVILLLRGRKSSIKQLCPKCGYEIVNG